MTEGDKRLTWINRLTLTNPFQQKEIVIVVAAAVAMATEVMAENDNAPWKKYF